jgi:hypothetical protein
LKESELDYYIIYFLSATIFKPIHIRTTGGSAILPGAVAVRIEKVLEGKGISKNLKEEQSRICVHRIGSR